MSLPDIRSDAFVDSVKRQVGQISRIRPEMKQMMRRQLHRRKGKET